MYRNTKFVLLLLFILPTWVYSFDTTYDPPKVIFPLNEKVKNLNPTFKWHPIQAWTETKDNNSDETKRIEVKGFTHDLIVFKEGPTGLPNKPVFYKENIAKTEFTIPINLERKSKYQWSVRTRKNGRVSFWRVNFYLGRHKLLEPRDISRFKSLVMVEPGYAQSYRFNSFLTE